MSTPIEFGESAWGAFRTARAMIKQALILRDSGEVDLARDVARRAVAVNRFAWALSPSR